MGQTALVRIQQNISTNQMVGDDNEVVKSRQMLPSKTIRLYTFMASSSVW